MMKARGKCEYTKKNDRKEIKVVNSAKLGSSELREEYEWKVCEKLEARMIADERSSVNNASCVFKENVAGYRV